MKKTLAVAVLAFATGGLTAWGWGGGRWWQEAPLGATVMELPMAVDQAKASWEVPPDMTVVTDEILKRPVVAFSAGGLPDIVEDHRTGYLAKAFETEELARGIAWVLAESQLLSAVTRERAVARFSNTVVAERYWAVYSRILNNSG